MKTREGAVVVVVVRHWLFGGLAHCHPRIGDTISLLSWANEKGMSVRIFLNCKPALSGLGMVPNVEALEADSWRRCCNLSAPVGERRSTVGGCPGERNGGGGWCNSIGMKFQFQA